MIFQQTSDILRKNIFLTVFFSANAKFYHLCISPPADTPNRQEVLSTGIYLSKMNGRVFETLNFFHIV